MYVEESEVGLRRCSSNSEDCFTTRQTTVYNFSDNFNWSSLPNNTVYECSAEVSDGEFLSSIYFQITTYILYGAVFFFALTGNGLVCFVVQTSPRMKTVTNYFIVNLAVGDILMSVFCVPFSFVSQLVLHYWPFGATMCKLVNYSQAVSVLVSAYTLVAISADRYMAIMHPLRPRMGSAAAKAVVGAVWGGALATAAPIPVVSVLERPTPWHYYCEMDICRERWSDGEQMGKYTIALLALQFLLPLTVLVFTYARIAVAVWGGRPPGEAERARDRRMARSKRKMVKMMVTVVIVFTICWLPLNILIMAWTLSDEDSSWEKWPALPYVWFAAHWLAMSHSCYNPVIYCYMNLRYRRGFYQVLGGVICCRGTRRSFRRTRRFSMGGEGGGFSGNGADEFELHHNTNGCLNRCGSKADGCEGACERSRLRRASTCTSYVSVRVKNGALARAAAIRPNEFR